MGSGASPIQARAGVSRRITFKHECEWSAHRQYKHQRKRVSPGASPIQARATSGSGRITNDSLLLRACMAMIRAIENASQRCPSGQARRRPVGTTKWRRPAGRRRSGRQRGAAMKQRKCFGVVVWVGLWLLSSAPVAADEAPSYAAELVFPLHPQHNHAPGIVECPNGDLLVSWYRGSGERTADDVAVYGARKAKGSLQWSEPFLLADTPGFPDCNTCLMIDRRQRLWLFWPVHPGSLLGIVPDQLPRVRRLSELRSAALVRQRRDLAEAGQFPRSHAARGGRNARGTRTLRCRRAIRPNSTRRGNGWTRNCTNGWDGSRAANPRCCPRDASCCPCIPTRFPSR